MRKTNKRKPDFELDATLHALARRYRAKTLWHWWYDAAPPYVMPLIEYVRICGTHVGYRGFVRRDEAQKFIHRLACLPDWLVRA